MTENNDTEQDPIAELDKKNLDIQGILEKIKNLPIDNKDKATILEQFKNNILNPSAGENKNLDQIQAKYTTMQNPQSAMNFLPPVNANYPYSYGQQQQSMYPPPQNNAGLMTTTHFEILKNKLDSLQLESVDLLRHVKDYTQRYMNSVRQQDLEKINEYINGLFQVDKTLKETKEKAEEAALAEQPTEEEEPATNASMVSKATSGIKNFLGGIGNNVAGITDLVTSTANIANSYLSKKILPTSNASTTSSSTTNTSRNKNIVSVDEYITSNMNNLEKTDGNNATKPNVNIPNSNNVSVNSNNINSNSNKKETEKEETTSTEEEQLEEEAEAQEEPASDSPPSDKALNSALDTLNKKMNEDIENTVKQQGGSSHKDSLTKKISLLRLKLTKKKLQQQLKDEKNKTSKYFGGINKNNKNNKHKMKKSKLNKKIIKALEKNL